MLFDTTFVIDFEREVKRARPGKAHAFLQANPNAPLFISIITVGEFAEGFQAAQQTDCWQCLRLFTVLDLTRDIAWDAGQNSRQLRAAGQIIGENGLAGEAGEFGAHRACIGGVGQATPLLPVVEPVPIGVGEIR